jgi:chromosome partitioning protein
MRCTTIAFCNQKGGVGKTTSTLNIGAALASMNYRVLLVDFDPQGALSTGLGISSFYLEMSIYNLLFQEEYNRALTKKVIVSTNMEKLDLLPSNIDLSGAEVQLVMEVSREFILLRLLKYLSSSYDYILIDSQPSLGLLTINALVAAQHVIIPLECEFFAMRGMALLIKTIKKIKLRLNKELAIAGILPTMFDENSRHQHQVREKITDAFKEKVFSESIRREESFSEATLAGDPLVIYKPESLGARSYRSVTLELLSKLNL